MLLSSAWHKCCKKYGANQDASWMGSKMQLCCKTVSFMWECQCITWSNEVTVFPLPTQTQAFSYIRKHLNLQQQSGKIWVVALLSGRKPLSLCVRLALGLKSWLTTSHFGASTPPDLCTTFQAWDHRLVSLTPAAPNIIPGHGFLPALTHFLWNSPSPSFILSPTQTSLSFPQICSPWFFSLWLRVSITLELFIPLLRFSIHQLLMRNAKESSLQLQPASPPKVFLPRGTITTAQAKILSRPDKGSLEALIANDLRKPVLQFHSP